MIIYPLSRSIATLLMAPDADAATLGGGIADVIPPVSSAPSVTDVILGDQPAIEASSAVKVVAKETTKGPTDFGMESADESSQRAGLKDRARGPDGKFVPKDPNQPKTPEAKPPTIKATAQPPAPQKPAAAKPAAPAAKPEPVAPAKVKIGDVEKTADEWATHFKDLEAKAKAAAEKPEPILPKEPEPPAETDEQKAAAQQQREEAFLTKRAAEYVMPEADLDEILMGGQKGAQRLGMELAKAEMRGRQFAANQANEIYAHLEQRLSDLAPVLDQHQQVAKLLAETAFINGHEDIKTHPKGLETFRKVSNDMNEGYKAIKAKVDAGTATKSEQGWALQFEDMSPEALQESFATHTRAELAKIPNEQPAKPAAPPAKPPVVVEKPLGGDRPGGAGSPRTETHEASLARQIADRHR